MAFGFICHLKWRALWIDIEINLCPLSTNYIWLLHCALETLKTCHVVVALVSSFAAYVVVHALLNKKIEALIASVSRAS